MLFSAVFKECEMARIAVLAGVAHDIAHHAASALSYLSPHLALALRAAHQPTTQMDLLDPCALSRAGRRTSALVQCDGSTACHRNADIADPRFAGSRSEVHGVSCDAGAVGSARVWPAYAHGHRCA